MKLWAWDGCISYDVLSCMPKLLITICILQPAPHLSHTQARAAGASTLCNDTVAAALISGTPAGAGPAVVPPSSSPGGSGTAAGGFLWWPIVASVAGAALVACTAFFIVAGYRRRRRRAPPPETAPAADPQAQPQLGSSRVIVELSD